jgi:antitoxin FitA
MIQLRHLPDALHRRLKAREALSGLPLSDFLIREVRKIAEHPSADEMAERLRQRSRFRGEASPTDIIREGRDSTLSFLMLPLSLKRCCRSCSNLGSRLSRRP